MEKRSRGNQRSSVKAQKFKISFIVLSSLILLVFTALSAIKFLAPGEKKQENYISSSASSIPKKILDNKFGFLTGYPGSENTVSVFGGAWGRPHPGPFLWDSMQRGKSSSIDFEQTDQLVENYQEEGIGILATLWPFANWDQKERPDPEKYKVSSNDEFLPKGPQKHSYLPEYRGNPHNWDAYTSWIKSLVERYDGDGKDDMPGLEMPIKYWEVMNEPDLGIPDGVNVEDDGRLDFYKEGAPEYAELLIKTYAAIKEADPEAKVIIAGAAGGNDHFLNFYRKVFANKDAINAFDIANVHCISNDGYESFNVEPYKKMLAEFGINKPIWVTEAEAMVSDNADINATQTYLSAKKALELGVEKIFFTRFEFKDRFSKPGPKRDIPNIPAEIKGDDSEEAYKIITDL